MVDEKMKMTKPPRFGPPEKGPAVTIIIPVFNNAETIIPLLDSLACQTIPADEIIVVDDGSTDRTAELVENYPIPVKILRLEKNSGPSVARNKGVETASNEIIFFLDSDVVVDSEAVGEIKSVFQDPEVKAINGLMKGEPLNTGWSVWYKCLVELAWGDFVNQWDCSSTCLNTRIGGIRRSVFLRAGGFDPYYTKPLVEDHEFGQRLVKHCKIMYDKNLRAYHHFSDFRQTVRNYWDRTQALLKLLWTTPGASTDKGGASRSSALEFLVGAALLVSLMLSPWFGAWLSAILLFLFMSLSYRSLKYCFRIKGTVFYFYSVFLHAFYGFVVTLAGAKAFWSHKVSRLKLKSGNNFSRR